MLFLYYGNNNNPLLPFLPKHRGKEKNGKKSYGKQNYLCKSCLRQFIGDYALSYKGWYSELIRKILLMLVRGIGIRNIVEIENISIKKILSTLVNSNRIIKPKQSHYDCRLRHRIRRAFRKTCCLSKKLYNHLKAFNLAFFYINYGYV